MSAPATIARTPVRATTGMLLTRAAADFDAAVNQIMLAAVRDGEVVSGVSLDLTQGTPVWLIPITQSTDG